MENQGTFNCMVRVLHEQVEQKKQKPGKPSKLSTDYQRKIYRRDLFGLTNRTIKIPETVNAPSKESGSGTDWEKLTT